ncbi:MAG: hypothetical protein ACI3W5_16215 [Faecousia sp.]
MQKESQSGAITLEACVSVLSFLILMLFLSSLYVMFMAQNVTAHTAMQTAQSLALEAYSVEKMVIKDDNSAFTVSDVVTLFVKKMFGSSEENPSFVADTYWLNDTQTQLGQIVKTRFIGYLNGGNTADANEFLKKINITKGTDGLDFSESQIKDGTLYVVVKYELEYDFNIWGVKPIQVKQTACAKLWK